MLQEIVERLRNELPSAFAGTALNKLTGESINWRTIQNKRSRREIPEACFVRAGKRVLIVRDPFLDWWATTLRAAR